jgi:hypothetical protein
MMTPTISWYWLKNSDQNDINQSVSLWLSQGIADGGTSPTPSNINALSTFMNTLDLAGLGPSGSRMKTGNILHTGSKQFCLLNLKDVSNHKLVESGTVTFSEGNGCRSASSSYFEQPFTTDEYAGIQSNLTAINYVSESSTAFSGSKALHGFRSDAARIFTTVPLNTSTLGQGYHFTAGATFPSTNHRGLYVLTRSGANLITYKDGSKTSIAFAANVPAYNGFNRYILAYNNNNGVTPAAAAFYPHYVAIDFLYDGFTDADELAFRTAFNTYKTAVGLP